MLNPFGGKIFAENKRTYDPKVNIKIEGEKEGRFNVHWEFKVPSGFHFNLEAPNKLEIQTPSKGEKQIKKAVEKKPSLHQRLLNFHSTIAVSHFSWSAELYICDDKKTFCDRVVLQGEETGQASVSNAESAESVKPKKLPEKLPEKKDKLFIVNEPEVAFDLAKKHGRLILIDFFGIWCPPCNELDEKVFSNAAFKSAAKDWVLLKLDADRSVSWKWKSQYKVGGYPTLVFANAQGEEISRMVGFQPLKVVVGRMQLAQIQKENTKENLEKTATQKNSSNMRLVPLIEAYIERREYDQAAKILDGIEKKSDEEEFLDTWVGLLRLERPKAGSGEGKNWDLTSSKFVQNYGREIRSLPIQIERLHWLHETGLKEQLKEETLNVLAHLKWWKENPKSFEIYGFTYTDLLTYEAEVHQILEDKASEKAVWAQVVNKLKKEKKGVTDRGTGLELAYAYRKLENVEAAAAIYRELIKKYPEDFTFYFAFSQMEFQNKNFGNALKWANEALKWSYEDNRLRVLALLGRIQLGIREDAGMQKTIELIEGALKGVELPSDESIRTHRYFKEVEKVLGDLKDQHRALFRSLGKAQESQKK